MSQKSNDAVAVNRRARFDYEVEETYEAGIQLVGSEVKSLRDGRANIADDAQFGSPLARQRFCVQYWVSDRDVALEGVLNVRVRVVWPVGTLDTSALGPVCDPATANGFQPDVSRFRTVVLPAAIRRHES